MDLGHVRKFSEGNDSRLTSCGLIRTMGPRYQVSNHRWKGGGLELTVFLMELADFLIIQALLEDIVVAFVPGCSNSQPQSRDM